MSLQLALELTTHLLAFAMFLQAIEITILAHQPKVNAVWNYKTLRLDLETGLPFPKTFLSVLFSEIGLKITGYLQILLSLLMFFAPHPIGALLLCCTHLLICLRFRGTFNGGSDMMTFVVLTGLTISLWQNGEMGQKLGLIYISIHSFYSYFKAGLVKLLQSDWRKGQALSEFLERSLFLDTRKFAIWLGQHQAIGLILCWSIIVFEIAILALPFFPSLVRPYFWAASLFHFINYLSFGLNRFFWIWLSTWPALLFFLSIKM